MRPDRSDSTKVVACRALQESKYLRGSLKKFRVCIGDQRDTLGLKKHKRGIAMKLSSQTSSIWSLLVNLFILGFLATSTVGCFGGGDEEEMSDDIEMMDSETPAEFGDELGSVDSENANELDVADLEEEQSSIQEETMIPTDSYGNDQMAAEDSAASDPQNSMGNQETMPASGNFEYKIKRGDWLSKIAIKVYGDMSMWSEIARANPKISNPDLIYAGDNIMIPVINAQSEEFSARYQISQSTPENDGSELTSTYTVQRGDTLSSIAEAQLGGASKWGQLTELNPEVQDATNLQIGTVLQLTNTNV